MSPLFCSTQTTLKTSVFWLDVCKIQIKWHNYSNKVVPLTHEPWEEWVWDPCQGLPGGAESAVKCHIINTDALDMNMSERSFVYQNKRLFLSNFSILLEGKTTRGWINFNNLESFWLRQLITSRAASSSRPLQHQAEIINMICRVPPQFTVFLRRLTGWYLRSQAWSCCHSRPWWPDWWKTLSR